MTPLFSNKTLQDQFNKDGYIILDLLSQQDILNLRKQFFEKNPDYKNEDLFESSRNRTEHENNEINDLLQSLFKKSLEPYCGDNSIFGGTFLVKPAKSTNFLPLHQDWSIVEEEKFQTAFVWCPLQDTNSKNGGLFVVPGSHLFFNNRKSGSLPCPRIPFNEIIRSHTIELSLKSGQSVIYSDNLFHGSGPNLDLKPRLIATARIMEKGARLTYYQKHEENQIAVYQFSKDNYLNGIRELTAGKVPEDLTPEYFEENLNQEINQSTFLYKLTGQKNDKTMTYISDSEPKMNNNKQNFINTYTPLNISREIKYRLQNWNNHSQKVGKFYDQFHQDFMDVYGELIQAFRTTDIEKILDYEFNSIGLKDGMVVLDAGCGVCRPAIHFSSKVKIEIKALSVSKVQIEHAWSLIKNHKMSGIELFNEDYHSVNKLFPSNTFDRVYFLESFGHSNKKAALLQAVWEVLKPGGSVYIKDLFARKTKNKTDQKTINKEIDKINKQYHYEVADLSEIIDKAREMGFILEFAKTIDIRLEDFENLTISNKFQELTGIYKIDSFQNYIFPVDFIELRFYKPAYNLEEGKDRYFLQNLLLKQQNK